MATIATRRGAAARLLPLRAAAGGRPATRAERRRSPRWDERQRGGVAAGFKCLASSSSSESRPSGGDDASSGEEGGKKSFVGKVGEMQRKLKQLGLPALIAYGALNTAYYCGAFLIAFWSYSAVSGGTAAPADVKGQFGQAALVFGVVYAGSQVTKLLRASGAIVLAPQVDKALRFLQRRLGLRSQAQAAVLVTVACFFSAFVVFTGSVLLKTKL